MAETKKVYDVGLFHGVMISTTVTKDPCVVTDWINDIYLSRALVQMDNSDVAHCVNLHTLVVGFDAQARSNQHPYATVQLCVGKKCLVYQIFLSDITIPEALQGFMADEDIVLVGSNILYKLRKLSREYGLRLDGMRYAEMAIDGHWVRDFVFQHTQVVSDAWDAAELSNNQVLYATFVVYASYQIGVCRNAAAKAVAVVQ